MQPGPELGAELAAQLRDFLAQLRPQFGQPLLQLGVEAREIQLPSLRSGQAVQLAQIDNTLSKEVGDTLTIRLGGRSIKYAPSSPAHLESLRGREGPEAIPPLREAAGSPRGPADRSR
jgi:hypothetical protein